MPTRAARRVISHARAQLGGMCFRQADLAGATVAQSDLRGADLSGADLTGACFDGALLDGAHLEGVTLHGATFSRIRVCGRVDVMEIRKVFQYRLNPTSAQEVAMQGILDRCRSRAHAGVIGARRVVTASGARHFFAQTPSQNTHNTRKCLRARPPCTVNEEDDLTPTLSPV